MGAICDSNPINEKNPKSKVQNKIELKEACEQKLGAPLQHLSMGMSGDFEVAIEEGATIVRIGTALFGPRPRPAKDN